MLLDRQDFRLELVYADYRPGDSTQATPPATQLAQHAERQLGLKRGAVRPSSLSMSVVDFHELERRQLDFFRAFLPEGKSRDAMWKAWLEHRPFTDPKLPPGVVSFLT